MIFVKSVLGGVAAVVLMWIGILLVDDWRWRSIAKRQGHTGLGAMAGGWTYLLHLPSVIVLLTLAFGAGLYLTARGSS